MATLLKILLLALELFSYWLKKHDENERAEKQKQIKENPRDYWRSTFKRLPKPGDVSENPDEKMPGSDS